MPSPNPIYKRGRRNPPNMKKKIPFLVNWKTTAGGVASVLGGLVLLLKMFSGDDEFSTDQLAVALGLLGTGFAGITARDGNKSSQDNGIR